MRRSTVLTLLALSSLVPCAGADELVVYAAPKGSAAYEFAKGKADDETTFAERTFHKALRRAAELLAEGPHAVSVRVAGGEFFGKARRGVWVLPAVDNPEGSLRILGGFDDEFASRDPFARPTRLTTAEGRDGALVQLSKKTRLAELVFSGFVLDASPSNNYDAETNSLLKGSSRTYPLLSFALLKTDHLVVDSNVFLNGAHGAFDPYVVPLSDGAVVDVTNNFFLNTIKATSSEAPGAGSTTLREMNFRNNTFLLNWPFNPDATSSEVGAVKLYHGGGCSELLLEGNLFAYNAGGALQHDWPEERMPDVTLRGNLFYNNAALFGEGDPALGAVVGKFGTNPKYLVLDIETIEDDFDYDVEDNVVLDPEIPIALAELVAADSNAVERKDTVLNDVRRLFGLNQDGGTVAIANFAPALAFVPGEAPFPRAAAARGYGVQRDAFWNP